jgi:hypothetical protein
MLAHEPGRLFLRCAECGRETVGWSIASPRPSLPRADSRQAAERPEPRPLPTPHWAWRGREGRVAWEWRRWRTADAAPDDERRAA